MGGISCVGGRRGDLWIEPQASDPPSGVGGGAVHCAEDSCGFGNKVEFDFGLI